ncbi:hypothetical protein NADE_009207 [Nannochloris sp. 'desiccata']|nr:hypothetical protein KSW81_006037 [Chlorella desiccata (nom. nud.)]KAH7621159.1 hypothetical protein NADE_009207 [Chlorella desiccata (nom. nud.)]
MNRHIPASMLSYLLKIHLPCIGCQRRAVYLEVAGDLANSDEAKEFVKSLVRCGDAPLPLSDILKRWEQIDMWPQVYEVCGGNIGLLERCAKHEKVKRSRKKGLERAAMVPEDGVKKGLWPEDLPTNGSRSPAAWT